MMRLTLMNFTQYALIQTTKPHLMRFDKKEIECDGKDPRDGRKVSDTREFSPSFFDLPDTMKPVTLDATFTPYPLPKKDGDFEYGPTRVRNVPDVHAARRAEQHSDVRRHTLFQEADSEEAVTSESIFDILEDITPQTTTEKHDGKEEKDDSKGNTRTDIEDDDDEDELTSERMRSRLLRAQEDIRKAAATYAESKAQSRVAAIATVMKEEDEGANRYTLVESSTMLNVRIRRTLRSLLQQLDDSFFDASKDVRHFAAIYDLSNTLEYRTHEEFIAMLNHISEKFDFSSSTGSHFLRYYTTTDYRNQTDQMTPAYSIVNTYLFFLRKLEAYFVEGKGRDLVTYDELDQFQIQAALAAFEGEAPSSSAEASVEHLQRIHSNKVELIVALLKTLAHLKILDMDSWTTPNDIMQSLRSSSVQQKTQKKSIEMVDDLGLDFLDCMYESIAFGADASTEEGRRLSFVARTSTTGLVALLKSIVGVNAKKGLLDDIATPAIIEELLRRAKATRLQGGDTTLPSCSLQELEEAWLSCTMCMHTNRQLITEVFEILNTSRRSGESNAKDAALGPEGLLALSKLYTAVPSMKCNGVSVETETPSFNYVNSVSIEDRQSRIITELKASVECSRRNLADAKEKLLCYEKAVLSDSTRERSFNTETKSTTDQVNELAIAVKRAFGAHYRIIHASQEVLACITPISKATALCKELDLDTDAIEVIPPLRSYTNDALKKWDMRQHNSDIAGVLLSPRERRMRKMEDLRKKAALDNNPLQMEVGGPSLDGYQDGTSYFSVFNDILPGFGFLRSVGGNTHTLRNYEKILILHSTFITSGGDNSSMISYSLKMMIQSLVSNTSTAMIIPTSTLLELVKKGRECPYPQRKKRIWRSLALLCAAARDTHRNIFILSLSDELSLLRQECGGPLGEDQIVWLAHHYLQQSINPAAVVTVCCDRTNFAARPDMVLNGRGGLTAVDRDINFRHLIAETRFMRNGAKYGSKKHQRDALFDGCKQIQSSEVYMFANDSIRQAKMRVMSPKRQIKDIGKSFAEIFNIGRSRRWACRDSGIREKIRISGERNVGFAMGSKVDVSGLGLLSVGHPSVDRSKFPLEVKKNLKNYHVKMNTRTNVLKTSRSVESMIP